MTATTDYILEKYKSGQRIFKDLDIENETLINADLEGISFDGCFLAINFQGVNLRNSQFINGNIKTCTFKDSDLTNARFENLAVCSVDFTGSMTFGMIFNNNSYNSDTLNQLDFEEWILDINKDNYLKLIKNELASPNYKLISLSDNDYYGRSKDYPYSECFKFESSKFAGEISIYIKEFPYCEYELMIFENEEFTTDHRDFLSKVDIEIILKDYLLTIEKIINNAT